MQGKEGNGEARGGKGSGGLEGGKRGARCRAVGCGGCRGRGGAPFLCFSFVVWWLGTLFECFVLSVFSESSCWEPLVWRFCQAGGSRLWVGCVVWYGGCAPLLGVCDS